MTMVFCPTCGAELFDDEDPYTDPDCMECLKRSIEHEIVNSSVDLHQEGNQHE